MLRTMIWAPLLRSLLQALGEELFEIDFFFSVVPLVGIYDVHGGGVSGVGRRSLYRCSGS